MIPKKERFQGPRKFGYWKAGLQDLLESLAPLFRNFGLRRNSELCEKGSLFETKKTEKTIIYRKFFNI